MVKHHWTEYNILIVSHVGVVRGHEIVESALEISGDVRFDSTRYVLSDWTHSERAEVAADHVIELVAVLKNISKICPNAKNACVIRPDKHGNALMAFYKMLADDLSWGVQIFKDYDRAFDWFGLPHAQRPKI